MKLPALLLALAPGLAVGAPHDAEVAAVRALYARYATEAVIDDVGSPTLASAPPAVLRQHLTEELTRLMLRDRDCGQRTHEICRLDFMPLWDSQDPVGTHVKLRWDDRDGRVMAELRRGNRSARTVAYSLVKLKVGWRIDDIDFGPERPRLRQLLSASEPR
jgi:hypothetical protein